MNHTNNAQIFEIHILRAIACLLVVLVHVTATYYYQQGGYNNLTFFLNQIGRFGTPIFAVISGFLLFYQVRRKGFYFKRFISSRFIKIGAPFIFWSIFYLLLMFIFEGKNPFVNGKKSFAFNFLFGNSYVHLYFMSIVFQFYLLFPLLQRVRTRWAWSLLLVLSLVVNLYFVQNNSLSFDNNLLNQLISQRAFFLDWIFFFILGGFMAYNWQTIQKLSKAFKVISLIGLLFVILFTIYEYKIQGSVSSNRPLNFINIPVIIIGVIGLYENIKNIKLLNFSLKSIGQLSMGIYLVHMFIIYLFVQYLPAGVWTTWNFPVMYIAILVSSIILIKIIQMLPFNQFIVTVPKMKTIQPNSRIQESA